MSRKIGIICSIIISIIAYLMNNVFIDLEINIGANTLALIFGAISANLVPNIEKGGKWMIKIIMPLAIILLDFALNLTSFLKSDIGYLGLIVVIITAIIWNTFLIMYRKKHSIIGKDERIKKISQMAGSNTFVIFLFGFLIVGLMNVFYPLERTISAHTLASILGGIGLAMIFCNAVFYIYYKRKY